MKKLLLGALVTLASIVSTHAQTTIFQYNFSTSGTNLPVSGWSQDISASSDVDHTGWYFGTSFPLSGALATYIPAHGTYAFVDDYDYNTGHIDADTLYLPVEDFSTYQHVLISFDLMFWYNSNNLAELGRLIISTNGGSSWTLVQGLAGAYGSVNPVWNDSVLVDISSYAAGQSNVRLAFMYSNNSSTVKGYGMAIANINVFEPLNYDLPVITQNTPYFLRVGQAYNFSGYVNNAGGDTISSFDLHYSVNGAAAKSETFSGISGLHSLYYYNWATTGISFTPATAGIYTVKYWADNLNGSYGNDNSNDTLTQTFQAYASLPIRQSLLEEFTGQSCVYCMLAGPNMDSVATNNANNANIVRYHVPIPGRDFMYDITTADVSPREAYYGVTGAPQAFLDATPINPSTFQQANPALRYSSTTVQAENALGSAFTIDISSANFDAKTDSFSIEGTVTSNVATFPDSLTLRVALTIDSITYFDDLSTDDPTKSFYPPIGTDVSGAPDYYYPYVLKFPHVMEQMLPSASGTRLAAFTTVGSSQSFTFGWKQNHPWGQYPKGGGVDPYTGHALGDSTRYDSSSTGQFVVFLQTDGGVPIYSVPGGYVFQSKSASLNNITGMQEISNGIYFEMYPNPTNNTTTLAFKLDESQNVNVAVYNMLGQQVYSINEGNMSAGMHTIPVNCSSLQNGMYFVKFNADNASTTNKLIIQR